MSAKIVNAVIKTDQFGIYTADIALDLEDGHRVIEALMKEGKFFDTDDLDKPTWIVLDDNPTGLGVRIEEHRAVVTLSGDVYLEGDDALDHTKDVWFIGVQDILNMRRAWRKWVAPHLGSAT